MKKYNGEQYIEVVAVISKKNVATSDRATISSLMISKQVKTFVDKDDANLLRSIVLDTRKEPTVLFYLCEEDEDKIINALDIKTEFMLDNKQVTPYELINRARTVVGTDQIFDTSTAARLLRKDGYKVSKNKHPKLKYKFTS